MPFLDVAHREPVLYLLISNGVWACKTNIWACSSFSEKHGIFSSVFCSKCAHFIGEMMFPSLFPHPCFCLRLPALSHAPAGFFNEVAEMSPVWRWLGWCGALEELEQQGLCLQKRENSLETAQLWLRDWTAARGARNET